MIELQTWSGKSLTPGKYRAVIQLGMSKPESLSLSLNGKEKIEYRLEDGAEHPHMVFDFDTKGEPMQLILDPRGSEIKIASLIIIPGYE
jgi:hypothetical protein